MVFCFLILGFRYFFTYTAELNRRLFYLGCEICSFYNQGNVSVSTIFDLQITVQPEHIDALGHVNNVVYMQWMQQVAGAHINQLGLGLKQYLELKHAMVAVEHHVQYLKPTFVGEQLILRTWLSDLNALYSTRQYVFYRPQDQAVVFVGNTKWACVEIASGRSKRMSPTFTQAYQPLVAELNPMDFSQCYLAEAK